MSEWRRIGRFIAGYIAAIIAAIGVAYLTGDPFDIAVPLAGIALWEATRP